MRVYVIDSATVTLYTHNEQLFEVKPKKARTSTQQKYTLLP